MSAFAAIVQKHEDGPAIAGVAAAIAPASGPGASIRIIGRCALIVAPLHSDDPPAPVVLPSGVGVAGQILLEDQRHLAATLGEPSPASGAAVVASAYDRWGDQCT